MGLRSIICKRLDAIEVNHPMNDKQCKEGVEFWDSWVHLRVCIDCGHIGCCDSSKNKHATRPFLELQHPVFASAAEGEFWAWCYLDKSIQKDRL